MVADKRHTAAEIDDRIICTEVFGPEEALLTELDRGREETEHCPQDRESKKGRQTATKGIHPRPFIQVHGRLLLLHLIRLTGVLPVDFLDIGLQGGHLC